MGAAAKTDIIIEGISSPVPDNNFISCIVERDMFQPDLATIVLSNHNHIYTPKLKIGAPVELKVSSASIFKGEVLAIEPTYKGDDKTLVTVRAVNKLHRLLRHRKSITFADKTDQQIVEQVCGDAGLTLEWKHDKSITHPHVYQHNLTDLEFLRMRAARMGCHVWCEDTKLFVKQPDLGATSGIKLSVHRTAELRAFTPRMSSSSIVKKVTVKGWNPETKELIIGEASAENSPLGSQNAVAACGDLGKEETFTVDHPIWSKEEADVLAKARLQELNLTFITGEAEVTGNPKIELGKTVEIEANAKDQGDPFNGKYYVMGVTHRHTLQKDKDGGYVSIIRFARDAQKK